LAWTVVKYEDEVINSAGKRLIEPEPEFDVEDPEDYFESQVELGEAYNIVNNFRAAHSYPLNTFQSRLRRTTRSTTPGALVSQRIKRLSSIKAKLARFPKMRLTQMQDLGGCRAVVSNVKLVGRLKENYDHSRMKHELVLQKDYIANPKPSGYRGVHLVYRYHSDKKHTHEGLKTEVQLRSQLQHAWATAVETVGTMLAQALKASQGDQDWQRFFALMGSAIAVREECPPVPDTPSDARELRGELADCAARLNVEARLKAYGTALSQVEEGVQKGTRYFLLEVDPTTKTTKITGFPSGQLEEATAKYLDVERGLHGPGAEAVLVSVDSLALLRAAYPSYFLDADLFLAAMETALK
jgi:ppGpp synthetase/RelA/SpoT-type nucleotidyltranferase